MATTKHRHAREDVYDSADANACQDGFKYRLVEENGRYRFESIKVTQGIPCAGTTLAALVDKISGAWLDEIDPDELRNIECAKGSSCPKTLAAMVADLQELLL
jgi:hypothetical protein